MKKPTKGISSISEVLVSLICIDEGGLLFQDFSLLLLSPEDALDEFRPGELGDKVDCEKQQQHDDDGDRAKRHNKPIV